MSQRTDTYTRWAVIASGEGGNRISAGLLDRRENPGIDDRIVVMNTHRSDIRNTLDRLDESLDDDGIGQQTAVFGSTQGVGNDFEAGRAAAEEWFDLIAGTIRDAALADAFMHVTTLGGGTGNGSIPYVIRRFKSGDVGSEYEPWMDGLNHIALAVWPYYDEQGHRHFNAICGLSRLLRMPDGSQNADMVLLAANSHLADGDARDTEAVNERLITALDLLIGAGREADGVIDVQDYISVPSQIGAYHFTPAVATGLNGSVMKLEYMFDRAAENAYVPLDVATSKAAFAVVRVPRRLHGTGQFTQSGVQTAFKQWREDNGLGAVPGMTTVTPKDDGRDEVDVLLLFGGFDLEPLLDHSCDQFEHHKSNLDAGRQLGNVTLGEEQMDRIERNLNEYLDLQDN